MRVINVIALLLLAGCTGDNPHSDPTKVTGIASPGVRMTGASATTVLFEPGTTSTSIDGRLEANQDAEFVMAGTAGAMLVASVVGSQHEVAASVHRADTGAEISDATPDHSFWVNRLPESIGYLVGLHGTSEPTD